MVQRTWRRLRTGIAATEFHGAMRLGILSDSHDALNRTHEAVRLLRAAGAESLVHCGDLASPPIVAACAALPFRFAFGNHDADSVPELRRAADEYGAICMGWRGGFEMAGKRIGEVHGHMSSDLFAAVAERPDYLLSGHSHAAGDTMSGTIRRINPGALFRASEFTVALLDLETDDLHWLGVG